MRLTCPACGALASIEAWLSDAAARQCLQAALSLPASLAPLVLRYLALFRPRGNGRALSWERAAKLLQELAEPIRAGRVERHGRPWVAPLDYWQAALEQVLAARDAGTLQLPLRSHGYLYEVVAGYSNRSEARTEAAQQQAQAYPYARVQVPEPLSKGIPASVRDELARFRRTSSSPPPQGGGEGQEES